MELDDRKFDDRKFDDEELKDRHGRTCTPSRN
jgi:hypothetical protein